MPAFRRQPAAGAAVLFFLLSNFEVWLSGHGQTYPRNLPGLVACYIAAIPFGLNMLYGNLLFSALLFGGMEFVKAYRTASLIGGASDECQRSMSG